MSFDPGFFIKSVKRRFADAPDGGTGTGDDGDAYILDSSPTAPEWSGEGGKIAVMFGGSWLFIPPVNGMQVYNAQEKSMFVYDDQLPETIQGDHWYPLFPHHNLGGGQGEPTGEWTELTPGITASSKPFRRMYADCGALPNNTTKNVPHSITNIDPTRPVWIRTCAYNSITQQWINFSSGDNFITVTLGTGNIILTTTIDATSYTKTFVEITWVDSTD